MTEKLFKALYKHDNQIYHKFAHVMHSILFDTSMDISRYGQGHITYTGTINDDPCLQTQFSECSSLVLNIYLHACVKKKCMPYKQLFLRGKYLNNFYIKIVYILRSHSFIFIIKTLQKASSTNNLTTLGFNGSTKLLL